MSAGWEVYFVFGFLIIFNIRTSHSARMRFSVGGYIFQLGYVKAHPKLFRQSSFLHKNLSSYGFELTSNLLISCLGLLGIFEVYPCCFKLLITFGFCQSVYLSLWWQRINEQLRDNISCSTSNTNWSRKYLVVVPSGNAFLHNALARSI